MLKHFRGFAAAGAVVAVMMIAAGCGSSSGGPPPSANKLALPSSPVTLNLVDVAGDTQVAQPMINAYIKAHPKYLSKVNFETGDATEIVSKLKAQQAAGVSQIDIVLTGNDALGLGVNQGVFQKLYPTYKKQLGSSIANYQPGAMKLFQMTQGYATVNDFGDYGPLLEYLPKNVSNPPTTPAELLAWAKQHPGQFMYADPANSGPGRALVQGLPYILGDSNPRDPIHGWNKTWAYLQQLGKYIAFYPSGTTDTMTELANGSRKLIASTAGWDINARAISTVPKDAQISAFGHTSWIMDSSYVAVPKGISASHLAVVLDLIKWMLSPTQQAKAYDTGYMYPGPAVKGATLNMAPKADQNVIHQFGRAEYQTLLPKYPAVPPLTNKALAAMFSKWDHVIGGKKLKS
ncbi:MAG: extracellular solute-binding protein [Nocardiopsaceae bacterium]|jgi:putative spermidine/putrescine transport system substrate-binding protein|nr:extracellular solute-binding protein [Nocardiopsaceae bacterium]